MSYLQIGLCGPRGEAQVPAIRGGSQCHEPAAKSFSNTDSRAAATVNRTDLQ